MSAISVRRFLLVPTPLTVLCFLLSLPFRPWLPRWLDTLPSKLTAPVILLDFEIISPIIRLLGLPYAIEQALGWFLLFVLSLCWFATVFMPSWVDFRFFRLSRFGTQLVFLASAATLSALVWFHLFYGVPDE